MIRLFLAQLVIIVISLPAIADSHQFQVPVDRFNIIDNINCKFGPDFASSVVSGGLASIAKTNPSLASHLYEKAIRLKPVAIECSVIDGDGKTPWYSTSDHLITIRRKQGHNLGCMARGTIFHEYLHALGLDHKIHAGSNTTPEEFVSDPVYACHIHSFKCLKHEVPELFPSDDILNQATRTCGNINQEHLLIIPGSDENFMTDTPSSF